ncbi:class F sortase [Nocardioides sp. AX2bis]|uniref:class F sortase n=1 Tax=Nocardioides sp. AX2bis TaxID=2653157 RepID=UPI0012F39120|nr:class F sortase [Nocardioides sp. AX2bis]VXB47829.1 Class F sortase [Nocardioides sp. AX2bis]
MPATTTSPRNGLPSAASVVLLTLALAAGCAPVGDAATSAGSGPDDAPAGTDDREVRELEATPATRVGSAVARVPTAVRLPGTDLLDVVPVGTREDGLLDVPADVDVLGWWEGGARVGDPFGSVLLAGHVDSEDEGLGPSARLLTVERGDEVEVRAGGRTTSYAVASRRFVPLDDLGSYPRILSADGPARVTLVTCAPPFLPDEGGYQNLAVVTALPERGAR